MIFWTAILMGLAGSLHCIGMCGPLAMALPSSGKKSLDVFRRITYSLGRISVYALLGFVFGLMGKGLNLFGWQQLASIFAGVLILVIFFFGKRMTNWKLVAHWTKFINKQFHKIWNLKGGVGALLFGVLNGILPCGLVYLAIAGSIVTANPIDGALYMFLFGLGTFPSMFFISMFMPMLGARGKRNFKRVSPILTVIFALLFIVRGLGLGIPYLSPKMNKEEKVECCHR